MQDILLNIFCCEKIMGCHKKYFGFIDFLMYKYLAQNLKIALFLLLLVFLSFAVYHTIHQFIPTKPFWGRNRVYSPDSVILILSHTHSLIHAHKQTCDFRKYLHKMFVPKYVTPWDVFALSTKNMRKHLHFRLDSF